MTTEAARPIIAARHLRKTFGELVAVADVSFTTYAGECFGILGPNGAGKTSTIRMIYGFSPLSGGELSVFGLDVRKQARAIKQRIGVCQQENTLDPDLTAGQNLAVFARYFDLPRDTAAVRARELLRFMALEHRQEAKAAELSGGMVRRLIIARALINQPDLLILDEPTTGLDPQSRHQVWERLETLRGQGLSILLTTHYMDEAARLCDRLIIMDRGLILAEGAPRDLIRRHIGHDIIEVSDPSAEVRRFVRERGLDHDDLGHRLIVYLHDGGRLYDEIKEKFQPGGYSMRMATLEDVFLRLTGRELRE
jgi:lipooligosaccharide transport system ATP-binding protein